MTFFIRAKDNQRNSLKCQDLSSREAIKYMFNVNYAIIDMVHGEDLKIAMRIILFLEDNCILMQWFDTLKGYIFNSESDMNLFLLHFNEFERVEIQP